MKVMFEVVFQVCLETFRAKEIKEEKPAAGSSRRQPQISALCKELRSLKKKRWLMAEGVEKIGINELQEEQHRRLLQFR